MRAGLVSCDLRMYRALTPVQPPHLLAAAAALHGAPLAAAALVEEEPTAVASGAAVHAGQAVGIGEQLDRVGRHGEGDPAGSAAARLEAPRAVVLGERAGFGRPCVGPSDFVEIGAVG